jgi:tetratricopeptide (TPR) repeat protein
VTAAPGPKPDPEPADTGPDADGWALLEALRRRMDDQAAQGRKTQQQVTQLAESIASLVDHQRRRTRGLNLNSFIAYVIFTMLCGAGFYMLYRSRAHELASALDHAEHERDAAVRRADDATAKNTARETADGRAWEVYQLLDAGKRSEAAGKLEALSALPLSRTERAILAARAHETQVIEVDAALKAAAASFKAGRHAEVIPPLEAALLGEPAGARAAAMHYYLGVAYAKANDLAKAVPHLQAAIAAEVDQDDARFQLASALDRSGQYAKARAEYDRFATAHPQSQLAVFAMRRSATLARMPAVAPAPVAPPATQPTQVTPAAATSPTPVTPIASAQPGAAGTAPPTVTPKPLTPAVQPPPQLPAQSPTAQPKPAAPKLQPKPVAPPHAETDSSVQPPATTQPTTAPSTTPMSTSAQLEPLPRHEPKPQPLPPSQVEPAPPPWPAQPPHESEPAPEPRPTPREDVPIEHGPLASAAQ